MKIKSIVLLIMVILSTPVLTFAADAGYGHAKKGGIGFLFLQLYDDNKSDHREIGRASCRERV